MIDTAMRIYQTHDADTPGMSDSIRKLQRLHLPNDLTGKSVLDIGCNEGFFCRIAKERGAARVVGIDFDRARLDEAIKRYSSLDIDFRFQTWETLPDEKFDYVFWTSAMHYERDPKNVVKKVRSALNDDGLFILECGVIESDMSEMRNVVRHSDVCIYPTRPYLVNEILSEFAVREVSPTEVTEGDPVPRAVFHCTILKPEIIVLRGPSGVGKTSFAQRSFRTVAAKIIRLDNFISRFCQAKYAHTQFLQFVQANYDPHDLGKLYIAIDTHSYTKDYIDLLFSHLSQFDKLTVIEGFLTDTQFERLQMLCSNKFRVWELNRVTVTTGSEHTTRGAPRLGDSTKAP